MHYDQTFFRLASCAKITKSKQLCATVVLYIRINVTNMALIWSEHFKLSCVSFSVENLLDQGDSVKGQAFINFFYLPLVGTQTTIYNFSLTQETIHMAVKHLIMRRMGIDPLSFLTAEAIPLFENWFFRIFSLDSLHQGGWLSEPPSSISCLESVMVRSLLHWLSPLVF